MKALKCDRCKNYYDTETQSDYIIRPRGKDNLDLCPDCMAAFKDWLGVEEETQTDPAGDDTGNTGDDTNG